MKLIFNIMDKNGNIIEEYIFNGNPEIALIDYICEDLIEEFKDKGAVNCDWRKEE